jgi:endonuclease/exonuclease/phosphatase family metal-dependent hydrolase
MPLRRRAYIAASRISMVSCSILRLICGRSALLATTGLEAALPSDKPIDRPWSAGVVTSAVASPITDARRDRYYGELLPFESSRPGTWVAARVALEDMEVTAVSLYSLMDERSDASVHRSLSELSPLFDHGNYAGHLVLGGDLNILAGRPVRPQLDRHQVVLARLTAYGLVDCLAKMRQAGPLERCPCRMGTECTHTWTYRRGESLIPYQDDYLFASRALARRLQACRALDPPTFPHSDHAPIVATFA